MRDEAFKRIGHLYPKVRGYREQSTGKFFTEEEVACLNPVPSNLSPATYTVIAWLWARTVRSPNPAYSYVEVPLASTFMLSTKEGKEAYVEVVIEDREQDTGHRLQGTRNSNSEPVPSSLSPIPSPSYHFTVKTGKPVNVEQAKNGTKLARGANFRCVLSDSPIEPKYIKAEGMAGRMGARLMAIVAEGARARVYLPPTQEMEATAKKASPIWKPSGEVPSRLTGGTCYSYGLTEWGSLFTPRQLVALTTFSDLVQEAREKVKQDALAAGMSDDGKGLDAGGTGATAYADAVAVYLAFAIDKAVEGSTTLCTWSSLPSKLHVVSTFGRQALPMTWDYAESNIFAESSGNILRMCELAANVVERQCSSSVTPGKSGQADAAQLQFAASTVVSTDPPYYDNIGYADLSDFFYVWLRRSLKPVFPDLLATIAVPKADELVATPYRHGSKEKAEVFFLNGMTQVMHRLAEQTHPAFPVTIYYAFKQSESDGGDSTASTGWETFLDAIIRAGFGISGTWPVRTERAGGFRNKDQNALASSIVLVCRQRDPAAPTVSRREFLRELNAVLPDALDEMTRGGINSPVAPVDLSQAIIGPGMAIFSKYAAVLEADGTPMSVRTALQLINRFLAEDDFDHDTQFCLHWFETNGWGEGKFGEADVLARAKGTSVSGVADAGVLSSGKGVVRLLRYAEYPTDWSPENDKRTPVWEALHHLIRALQTGGESASGALLAKMPTRTESIRQLAYRLYTLCERKGWAEEARAYNELITSWQAIETAAPKPGRIESQIELDL